MKCEVEAMMSMVSILSLFDEETSLMTKFSIRENSFVINVISEIWQNLYLKLDIRTFCSAWHDRANTGENSESRRFYNPIAMCWHYSVNNSLHGTRAVVMWRWGHKT